MLKSLNLERSDEENEKIICMLMALVKWGRGSEIIEQVTLWLDAAFATQNMNETVGIVLKFTLYLCQDSI